MGSKFTALDCATIWRGSFRGVSGDVRGLVFGLDLSVLLTSSEGFDVKVFVNKRSKPQQTASTLKLVANDEDGGGPSIPGLAMEAGDYEEVVTQMESARKADTVAFQQRQEELSSRQRAEGSAQASIEENSRLTTQLVKSIEDQYQVEGAVGESVSSQKINKLIKAIEVASEEANGVTAEDRPPQEFSTTKGSFVAKKAKAYAKKDKRARRRTSEEKFARDQQIREYNKIAEHLRARFDLDAVLAAAGLSFEQLVEEQPEDFLRLYFRSKYILGETEHSRKETSYQEVEDAIRLSKAHLLQAAEKGKDTAPFVLS
ncbi:hypothetical protein NDN08_007538 [Rhodosorus marinus]|uniref:Uncharacterized protein n=1 Tax=Rhodosorus marinus TaxID=101924 RepID=A0AAV8V1F4_9RHOD|nr:hypothetical protein NDN08_007538 [Rhodosorus marinus]